MKKIYMIPTTQVIKLQTANLMAGSMKFGGDTNATSGNLSREGDFWDDDNDYDE